MTLSVPDSTVVSLRSSLSQEGQLTEETPFCSSMTQPVPESGQKKEAHSGSQEGQGQLQCDISQEEKASASEHVDPVTTDLPGAYLTPASSPERATGIGSELESPVGVLESAWQQQVGLRNRPMPRTREQNFAVTEESAALAVNDQGRYIEIDSQPSSSSICAGQRQDGIPTASSNTACALDETPREPWFESFQGHSSTQKRAEGERVQSVDIPWQVNAVSSGHKEPSGSALAETKHKHANYIPSTSCFEASPDVLGRHLPGMCSGVHFENEFQTGDAHSLETVDDKIGASRSQTCKANENTDNVSNQASMSPHTDEFRELQMVAGAGCIQRAQHAESIAPTTSWQPDLLTQSIGNSEQDHRKRTVQRQLAESTAASVTDSTCTAQASQSGSKNMDHASSIESSANPPARRLHNVRLAPLASVTTLPPLIPGTIGGDPRVAAQHTQPRDRKSVV